MASTWTVEQVDRAADRLTAEQQHRGAAQDFDALDGQRVDGDRMVGGGVRRVDRSDTVGQNLDALARKAAEDGTRCAGGEARRRNARLAGQRVSDLAANVARQLVALEHRDVAEDVEAADIGRGDDDRVAGMNIVIAAGGGAILRESGRGEEKG